MFLSGSPKKDRRRIRLQMLIERATLNKSKMPDERERERKGEKGRGEKEQDFLLKSL